MPFNIKKAVLILISITVICLGIGLSILTYNGAFSRSNKPNNLAAITNPASETRPGNSNTAIVFSDGAETNKSYSIDEEKTVSVNSAKDITIDIPAGDINIIPENRTDIKANLHGTIIAPKDYARPELNANSDSSKVIITIKDASNVPTSSTNLALDIHIPSSYSQNITASSSAGDLTLSSMNLSKLDCTAKAGNISIQKLKLSTLSLKCSTGDIKGSNIESGETDFDVITGSVKMDGALGKLTGKISTGSANVSYTNFNNNVDISSSTGSIRLTLPKESEFNIKAQASIGNLSCDFPVNVSKSITGAEAQGTVKSNRNNISLNVSTGDIVIKD